MSRFIRFSSAAAFALALAIPAGALGAAGAGPTNEPQVAPHDLAHPLGVSQREARQVALEAKLQGKIPAGAQVAEVGVNKPGSLGNGAKGQYVDLALEGTDRVFVIIADFSDAIHPSYPWDSLGPQHNRDRGARPHSRQRHDLAGRLQQGALRRHVLQPDGEVLQGAVIGPLHDQR